MRNIFILIFLMLVGFIVNLYCSTEGMLMYVMGFFVGSMIVFITMTIDQMQEQIQNKIQSHINHQENE